MRNEISLDSPFFRIGSSLNFQHSKPELEIEEVESESHRLILMSPDILPPNYKLRFSSHPRSPWSTLIHTHNGLKSNQLSSPNLFTDQNKQEEIIEERLVFSDEEEECNMMTPIKRMDLKQQNIEEIQLHTTGRKSQFQPPNQERKSKPRQKGLRKLSQKAFEVVQNLKNATYKEVAAHLVEEMSEQDFEGENKEEQNIKRRVYDALNVLIALGVLKKDGRKIVSEKDRKGKKSSQKESQQINLLKQKIEIKTAVLQSKQKKLKEAQEKFQAIKYLLHRNQQTKSEKASLISFPFIGIMHNEESSRVEQASKGEFIIRTSESFQPFGDIDSLKWLQSSSQSMKELEQDESFL